MKAKYVAAAGLTCVTLIAAASWFVWRGIDGGLPSPPIGSVGFPENPQLNDVGPGIRFPFPGNECSWVKVRNTLFLTGPGPESLWVCVPKSVRVAPADPSQSSSERPFEALWTPNGSRIVISIQDEETLDWDRIKKEALSDPNPIVARPWIGTVVTRGKRMSYRLFRLNQMILVNVELGRDADLSLVSKVCEGIVLSVRQDQGT